MSSPRDTEGPAHPALDPYIEVHSDRWPGEPISLSGLQRVTIGRASENDVEIDWDAEVSGAHAVLERVADTWTIIDDGLSRNGTFVNDERVHGRRRLEHGDRIRMGRTLISFHGQVLSVDRTVDVPGRVSIDITPAEQAVLVRLCDPLLGGAGAVTATNREIADSLVVSVETVRTHMKSLFRKFDLQDAARAGKRARLARHAIDLGIVRRSDIG